MITLIQGTIENLLVDIEDRSENLLTLDGTDPKFSIRPRFGDDDSWVVENESASDDDLRAFCLINTVGWDTGEYELYIEFQNLPEAPKLGPMFFEVI